MIFEMAYSHEHFHVTKSTNKLASCWLSITTEAVVLAHVLSLCEGHVFSITVETLRHQTGTVNSCNELPCFSKVGKRIWKLKCSA